MYRFFEQSNDQKPKLGWQDILAPHIERMEIRMRQHPVALCLQDTAELDLNGQDTDGEPGVKTLWLGRPHLWTFAEGMEHMQKMVESRPVSRVLFPSCEVRQSFL